MEKMRIIARYPVKQKVKLLDGVVSLDMPVLSGDVLEMVMDAQKDPKVLVKLIDEVTFRVMELNEPDFTRNDLKNIPYANKIAITLAAFEANGLKNEGGDNFLSKDGTEKS